MMSAQYPKTVVSATRTLSAFLHGFGGKLFLMPLPCHRYRYVEGQRADFWWQILLITQLKYGNLRGHPTVWLQKGKFADELPNEETKSPTFTIRTLEELADII